jgi:hypothetical protein
LPIIVEHSSPGLPLRAVRRAKSACLPWATAS